MPASWKWSKFRLYNYEWYSGESVLGFGWVPTTVMMFFSTIHFLNSSMPIIATSITLHLGHLPRGCTLQNLVLQSCSSSPISRTPWTSVKTTSSHPWVCFLDRPDSDLEDLHWQVQNIPLVVLPSWFFASPKRCIIKSLFTKVVKPF